MVDISTHLLSSFHFIANIQYTGPGHWYINFSRRFIWIGIFMHIFAVKMKLGILPHACHLHLKLCNWSRELKWTPLVSTMRWFHKQQWHKTESKYYPLTSVTSEMKFDRALREKLYWPPSQLEAWVYGSNAQCQVLIRHSQETSITNHVGKLLLKHTNSK